MNILLAGGAGYIGSHTTVAVMASGHNVIIADNSAIAVQRLCIE